MKKSKNLVLIRDYLKICLGLFCLGIQTRTMKRFFEIYLNALRRGIVNMLLGKSLILEKIKTDTGYKLQLIDMNRRIPYGYWQTEIIDERDTKLSR